MNSNADIKEIVSLCDRISEVIGQEYPGLTIPDVVFALNQILYTFHHSFDDGMSKVEDGR